ncbi:hypothetical protein GFC01_13130 [Desulfofundulus thermobenzoicus]|uniref:DUF2267 domain-containing protein n=1 Tax=Desulfofundulus thermobenzoicus TaxID=29376 RepID=A0A6N7IUF2_9FIRM|nr:hypothetical protein [Desulfofundulus thermobenzoicus]MQL53183.1 hypothetical protein [Desulfofundulus thermobenzoicus]
MEWRPISEREFINYAKGLGNYCTYGDTLHLIQAVFKAFKQVMGRDANAIGELLPESIKPIWNSAVPAGLPGDSILGLIQTYGSFSTVRDAEKALVTLFGTIKEKQARYVAKWEQVIPEEIKTYWEKSRTIDEVQDAGQCL